MTSTSDETGEWIDVTVGPGDPSRNFKVLKANSLHVVLILWYNQPVRMKVKVKMCINASR